MTWNEIPWNPTLRTLRRFAVLCMLFFAALAIYQVFIRHQQSVGLAFTFALLALMIGPLGVVRPSLLRPVFVGWVIVAFPINYAASRLFLAVIYFGMITPLGLLFRLVGRDPLRRRLHSEEVSYWSAKPSAAEQSSYFRQF